MRVGYISGELWRLCGDAGAEVKGLQPGSGCGWMAFDLQTQEWIEEVLLAEAQRVLAANGNGPIGGSNKP